MSNLDVNDREGLAGLSSGWVFYDQSDFGRLVVRGTDRVTFLHNLTTNDVKGLKPGQGHSTVLPNVKGRILDWATLQATPEAHLLIGQPQARETVQKQLEFYHFMEDVEFEDQTDASCLWAVAGPESAAGIDGLLEAPVADRLQTHAHQEVRLAGFPVRLIRFDRFGQRGFRIWGQRADREGIGAALQQAGARAIGPEALEAARIAAGEPAYGRELSEDRNPLEAGLYGSVSFDKGCYLGQEVIARLDTYDKIARHLTLLKLGPEATPELEGQPKLFQGKTEVGWLSSWTPMEGDAGYWGLGYISRRNQGTELSLNERVPAHVEAQLTTAAPS